MMSNYKLNVEAPCGHSHDQAQDEDRDNAFHWAIDIGGNDDSYWYFIAFCPECGAKLPTPKEAA